MKITIVQGAFLPVPPLLGGAVEKVWFALGKEFAARGHEVTHISRRYSGLPASETRCGVHYVRISGFDTPRSLVLLKSLDLFYSCRVRRCLPTADILVTNTFWLPMLALPLECGRIYVHVARYPKGQMRLYARASKLQTVSHAVSEAIKSEVPRMRHKVSVIPYPVIPVNDGPDIDLERHRLRKKEILFVGRLHPEKGVHILIRAFLAIDEMERKEWRLVIVGPDAPRLGGGGKRYLDELKALAGSLNSQVQWIGPIFDGDRLMRFYREATLFVYPSVAERGETFGLAPLEAMSLGCVPVVSNLACFRDYVLKGVTGQVFDHSGPHPELALAVELRKFMADAEGCRVIAQAAEGKAREYELGKIAELYLADFASVGAARK